MKNAQINRQVRQAIQLIELLSLDLFYEAHDKISSKQFLFRPNVPIARLICSSVWFLNKAGIPLSYVDTADGLCSAWDGLALERVHRGFNSREIISLTHFLRWVDCLLEFRSIAGVAPKTYKLDLDLIDCSDMEREALLVLSEKHSSRIWENQSQFDWQELHRQVLLSEWDMVYCQRNQISAEELCFAVHGFVEEVRVGSVIEKWVTDVVALVGTAIASRLFNIPQSGIELVLCNDISICARVSE